jgi:transposase, IS5 family
LRQERVILKKGEILDASLVEAPVQLNNREENKQIKQGETPAAWKEKPNKLRQEDTDARWITHNGEDYYGYKDHIKADKETKLIAGYEVTSARVHDSQLADP